MEREREREIIHVKDKSVERENQLCVNIMYNPNIDL